MGFAACHPAVNFIYFACVMAVTLSLPHPIFLGICALCAVIYCTKVRGLRGLVFSLALVPCVVLFANWYAGFNHFGVTELGRNFTGNRMTLEALIYGFVLGTMAAAALVWMACVHGIFTTDKVVCLFGRVTPRLSLLLAILLRLVPRIKGQARKINLAQQGIGRSVNQGNILRRCANAIRILSMMITWTMEILVTASESMRARGSGLRGRTAFSIYRFDNRDRSYVVALFACMTLLLMGLMLNQGSIYYDPVIRMNPVTAMSWVFYGGYGIFCLMPLGLDLWTGYRFRKARRAVR